MGRSAGGAAAGGFNFQAAAIAYVYVHVLTGQPLDWLHGRPDVPREVEAETGGPGDDIGIVCEDGTRIEVQVKKGLERGPRLWDAMRKIASGLAKDLSLHAVLLVDSEASGPVKNDLRRDLPRVAEDRTEGLHDITTELVRKLTEDGLEDFSVLERLNIVERTLYETAGDHANALTLLRDVTDDPARAWRELELDGHKLMEERGGRTAEKLARALSGAGLSLSPRAAEPAVVAQGYRDWLVGRTASFRVPGTGVRLSVDKAWAELDARVGGGESGPASAKELEEWVASYDEWGRLAMPRDRTEPDGTFDAETIEMAGNKVVVVGGPGSGKSTLQMRLAHRYSMSGKTAVYVSLSSVAQRMRDGDTFREALLELAVGNSGLSRAKAEAVLDRPDFLLADGLDECDPDRTLVSSQLHDWALDRPNTKVFATTRPVGHDPSLLPGWRHVDLLPLDGNGSRAHAVNVMEVLHGDRGRAEANVEAFEQALEGNSTAKKAARNPLLLGFLVQLFVDDVPLARRRAQLYDQIVRLMRERPGRSEHPVGPSPSAAVAGRALEIAGWLLQHQPVLSQDELAEKLGEMLAPDLGCAPLAAQGTAEECISFWQERGVLDRVTAGTREAVLFVHPTLREYAAAQHASRFDDVALSTWISEVRRDASWRETVLLAAGSRVDAEVVETLLGLYDPEDLVGNELEFASQALVEMPTPPVDLVRRVAEHTAARLDFDIPSIVFNAAEAALGIARETPHVFAPQIEPLVRHPRFATRVAAMRILLECGSDHFDPDAVREVIEELMEPNEGDRELPQRRNSFIVWRLQDRIAYLGVTQLLDTCPGTETDGLVERVISGGSVISAGTQMQLVQDLLGRGYEEMVRRVEGKRSYDRFSRRFVSAEAMRQANQEDIEEDRKLLEIILEAVGGTGSSAPDTLNPPEARAVAALVRGLELGGFPVGTWELMVHGEDRDAVRVVFEGGVASIGIDVEQLAREAAGVVRYLEQVDPSRVIYSGLIGTLPKVPVSPDWHKAAEAGLAGETLVRALRHPSEAVAFNAARLIAHGGGAPEAKESIMGTLEDAPEHTYRAVAYLAGHVWGEEEILRNLLEVLYDGITSNNYWLILTVAGLPIAKDDARAAEALLDALRHEDPDVATSLADKMSGEDSPEFPLFEDLTPELEGILEHWNERGTTCATHGGTIYGDRCPECSTVPRSPRAALIRQLGKTGRLDLGYLVELCTDARSDVRREAARLVAVKAAEARKIPDLLALVDADELPLPVLHEIASLPAWALNQAKGSLTELLTSNVARVREAVMRAMARGDWIEPEQAATLARDALNDGDLGVRDRAAETLRTLEGS